MKTVRELRCAAMVGALTLVGLVGGCVIDPDARIKPGKTVLIPYLEDGGSNVMNLTGSSEGVFLVHRGGFFLTNSTWKWSGAGSFTLTPEGDGRKVRVQVKDPSGAFNLSENGFVKEYDPQGQPVIDPSTGQQLAGEFHVNWTPR